MTAVQLHLLDDAQPTLHLVDLSAAARQPFVDTPVSLQRNLPPASHCWANLHLCAVQPNIDRKAAPEDWRYREAATFVFGCILEGPSPDQLAQLVLPGLTFLLQVGCHVCFDDQCSHVAMHAVCPYGMGSTSLLRTQCVLYCGRISAGHEGPKGAGPAHDSVGHR